MKQIVYLLLIFSLSASAQFDTSHLRKYEKYRPDHPNGMVPLRHSDSVRVFRNGKWSTILPKKAVPISKAKTKLKTKLKTKPTADQIMKKGWSNPNNPRYKIQGDIQGAGRGEGKKSLSLNDPHQDTTRPLTIGDQFTHAGMIYTWTGDEWVKSDLKNGIQTMNSPTTLGGSTQRNMASSRGAGTVNVPYDIMNMKGTIKCGGTERWDVKTATDGFHVTSRPVVSTVDDLVAIKTFKAGKTTPRQDMERTEYIIHAKLMDAFKEADGDWHLVLKSTLTGKTMIAEIPDPNCESTRRSTYIAEIAKTRHDFEANRLKWIGQIIEVDGIFFVDISHGQPKMNSLPQRGVAANECELHPVLSIRQSTGVKLSQGRQIYNH